MVKQKQKRNHRAIVRVILGLLLITVGIGWYMYPCYREWMMKRDVDTVIAEFEQHYLTDGTSAGDAATGTAAADMPGQQTTAFEDLYAEMEKYNDDLAKKGQKLTDAWDFEQTPVVMASLGDTAIGYIEVPDMGIKMPLYVGASHLNMSKGAAVLSGTSMPIGGVDTNCVICGHRGWKGSAYFRNIEDMRTGSMVYITTPWGTLAYAAVSAKIIHMSELDSIFIQPGHDMVTLFSCYPYAHQGTPYRYVVYCERVADTADMTGLDVSPTAKEPEPLMVEGLDVDRHMAAEESVILFLEQGLRYILPAAVVIITVFVCLIHRKKDRHGKNTKTRNGQ